MAILWLLSRLFKRVILFTVNVYYIVNMYKPLVAVYVFDSYNALAQFLNNMYGWKHFFILWSIFILKFEFTIFKDKVALKRFTNV